MDVQFTREGSTLIAAVVGRIDGGNAHEFAETVGKAQSDDDKAMIMDFAELDYISSAGLRAVLMTAKSCKSSNSEFALCSLPDQIMTVFEVSGFDKIIAIHPDRAKAIASVNS